jgi:hypothetical protein
LTDFNRNPFRLSCPFDDDDDDDDKEAREDDASSSSRDTNEIGGARELVEGGGPHAATGQYTKQMITTSEAYKIAATQNLKQGVGQRIMVLALLLRTFI